jgi:hypothetical protein
MNKSNTTAPQPPSATNKASRSPAAQRMRRYRDRRRDGLRCLTIELHEAEIDALIRDGFLRHETRNDASAIILALYAYFARTLVVTP